MQKREISTYEGAVEYLLSIPKFTSKHGIDETRAFLHRLGDPDRKLSILHVAGTNGKGSVCAYLRCILEEAGYRVAVFTSPHLTDIRERFLIGGRMPSKEAFLTAFLAVYGRLDWEALAHGEGYHPTFFEYLFFMAMLLFAKEEPDYCILETGLGGRLDATNSVASKLLCVITSISFDHVEYLGDTIEAIAAEKAGIMREGTPLVYSDVRPEASAVFAKRAKMLQIPTFPVSKSGYTISKIKNKTIDFLCEYRYHKSIHARLHTIARYQVENAALAIRSAGVLADRGLASLTRKQVQDGVEKCFWTGRMQEVLPEVYVDGAHNEDGIRAFLETVGQDGCTCPRQLLFGVVKDKDYGRMLEELAGSGLFQKIGIVRLKSARGASLEALSEVMRAYPDCPCVLYETVEEALRRFLEDRHGERIYIAGSLYLVGEVLELLGRGEEGFQDAPAAE